MEREMPKEIDSIPIEWLNEWLHEATSFISYMASGSYTYKEKIKLEAISMVHDMINEYQQEVKEK